MSPICPCPLKRISGPLRTVHQVQAGFQTFWQPMRELHSHHYPDHKVETPSRVYLLIYHEMLWKELIAKLTFWPYLWPEKTQTGHVWRHWTSIESPNLEKFVKFNETIAIIIENVEHKARKVVEEKIPIKYEKTWKNFLKLPSKNWRKFSRYFL